MRASVSPLFLLRQLIARRGLVWQLSRRDVQSRYRGSALGIVWSFINPLLMLAVYTFVFTYVFKSRWGATADSATAPGTGVYAIHIFAGLILHAFLAENLARSPTLIVSQANLVKKVVFPLELLPPTLLLSSLFHFLMSLIVLLAAKLALTQTLPWTAIYLPLVIAPLSVFCLACDYLLASLGVFLRDIGQLVNLLITILMFLSPVFYPLSALPEPLRPLVMANPLTLIIEETRAVLIDGRAPHLGFLFAYGLGALLLTGLAFAFFQRTRRAFADIL